MAVKDHSAAKRQEKASATETHDSFDKLPLSIIPLSSATLRQAHLVKNSRMETMVELSNDSLTGSLQIRPQDIAANFPISNEDQTVINKLSELNSYDVYSLRTTLGRLGISVESKALALSDKMKERLADYSREFTRPLILSIFGDGGSDIADRENLQKIFRDPDVSRVQARLKLIADKTGIPVKDIPEFFLTYSDLFMSGAYYGHSYETLAPDIERCRAWLTELRRLREVTQSPRPLESCDKVGDCIQFLSTDIAEQLTDFKAGFEAFWRDINRKSFDRLRRKVEAANVSLGTALCGVSVKITDWSKTFPENNAGSPSVRIKYLTEKLEPGLERLKAAESEARLMAASF